MSYLYHSLSASQNLHAYRICLPFLPALLGHCHSHLKFLKREEQLADLRALLGLTGELKRHLKLLTVHSRWKD
jgi:hypothetical protein